jgi:hypothetical protein
MVVGCAQSVNNDLPWRNNHPAVVHGLLVGVEKEHDRGSLRAHRRMEHSGKSFTANLHPKSVKIDLRQFGAKFTRCRDKNLNLGGPDSGLVRDGIGEVEMSAPRHFHFLR